MELVLHEDVELNDLQQLLAPDLATDESAIETVRTFIESSYPVEPVMGMSERLLPLIDRLRGRQLLRELPEVTHRIVWMEFHIPTRGKGSLSVKHTMESENTIEVSIFGSGFGKGRKVSYAVTDSTDDRTDCASYEIVVRIKPAIYRFGGDDSVVLDIVGLAGDGSYPLTPCPHCGIPTREIDRFENELEPYLDLRTETTPRNRSYEITRLNNHNMKVGVQIPGIQVPLNLAIKLTTNVVWKVDYEFKPGMLYQPYRPLNSIPTQTPMWAVDSQP